MKLTLRTKGILAFAALVSYVATVGYVLSQERAKLLRYSMELEQVYTEEHALTKASNAVSHSLLKLQEKYFASDLAPAFEEQIALDVELVQAGLLGLLEFYPRLTQDINMLNRDLARLRAEPSRNSMTWLRDHGQSLNEYLELVTREARVRRDVLWERYRGVYDRMSVIAVIMGLLGAVFFGAVMTLFLTRLAWDISMLAARAVDIVSGYRGPPVTVTRHDEVGIREQFGSPAEVFTLTSTDSFPMVWHYYVTYLGQYRGFSPPKAYPPAHQQWRTMQINLGSAMQDPFIPDEGKPLERNVLLQISESESGPATVIRYVITPRPVDAAQVIVQ